MRTALFAAALLVLASAAAGCGGTTGSDAFLFEAAAGGPLRDDTQPFVFEEQDGRGRSWRVELTRARITIGPVYLNDAVLVSQAQETACFRHGGRYVGEVLSILQVDALSPALTFFPSPGRGVAERVRTAEVWLVGPETNLDGSEPVVDVAGVASNAELGTFPFEGAVALTRDWLRPPDPSAPGQNQLCELRQATNIPANFNTGYGGGLVVRVDPTRWFDRFDFSELKPSSPQSDAGQGEIIYRLGTHPNDDTTTRILVENLRSRTGVYSLQWVGP